MAQRKKAAAKRKPAARKAAPSSKRKAPAARKAAPKSRTAVPLSKGRAKPTGRKTGGPAPTPYTGARPGKPSPMKGAPNRPMPDFTKPGDGSSPYKPKPSTGTTPGRPGTSRPDDTRYPQPEPKTRLGSKSNKQLKKTIERKTANGKNTDKAKAELKSRKRFSRQPKRVRRIKGS